MHRKLVSLTKKRGLLELQSVGTSTEKVIHHTEVFAYPLVQICIITMNSSQLTALYIITVTAIAGKVVTLSTNLTAASESTVLNGCIFVNKYC